ncbi:ABC transporter ATP-binding protein [bacterium]|nr:ABC transporter ATP-binding protein [bacterium]MBU1958048.1 ABC transporter ATP-binding protein [bacterium]
MSERKVPLISFRGVTKVYGKGEATTYALRGIDLDIYEGEFVAIMGSSGSGKSTAMNIIGCLDEISSGEYSFQGVDVVALNRNEKAMLRRHYLGFIFQGFNLLGRTSVLENVELPLIYRGTPEKERVKIVKEALRSVGLEEVMHHTPAEISGGQQQRVAIARAIATNPLVMLADEPTGNLDTARSREVMELLQSFNREQGITIIMVTHESEMAAYADRIVHFTDGLIDSDNKSEGVA